MDGREELESRWWYGIDLTVSVGVLAYGFTLVLSRTADASIGQSDGTLIATVLSAFGLLLTGLVLLGLTVVFVLCFIMDWKQLRDADVEWTPSVAYLLVPLGSLANFVRPIMALPVMVLGGGVFLYNRSRHVGTPILRILSRFR